MMKEHSIRMLFAAVTLSALAALTASRADARIPEGTDASFNRTVVAQPVVVPYVSHGIGVDPSLFAGRTHDRRSAPRVPLRASVPSNSNRVFVWPTHGTSTYKRAAGMASHGDPEAKSFVSGRSDINPFDAR
jgi:hypothetical protein